MRRRLMSALLLALLGATAPRAATEVTLPQGSYQAVPPQGWNGRDALPVLLYFHGAFSTATDVVTYPGFTDATTSAGVLLVAPEGIDRGWAVAGAPRQGGRDERGFINAVLADLARRYPTQPGGLLVGGFSLGASLAAEFACAEGARIKAVLTVAGTFWRPLPQRCAGGPTNWLHLHGTADPTFPLAGRVVREKFHQGDADQALAMLGASYGCEAPRAAPPMADSSCAVAACQAGRALMSCRHPGGHEMHAAWLADFLRWAAAISSTAVWR
jgi:polyhydroxybutyrate depolymerase